MARMTRVFCAVIAVVAVGATAHADDSQLIGSVSGISIAQPDGAGDFDHFGRGAGARISLLTRCGCFAPSAGFELGVLVVAGEEGERDRASACRETSVSTA